MKNEQARIREAVRKIDVAEEALVRNAFPPLGSPREKDYREWKKSITTFRHNREDGIIELIDACRKYLKPGG
jgi:hypothetical protein